MNLKQTIKRAYKYIIKGEKETIVNLNVVESSTKEMFKDKVVLITGGGSGLGYHIAKRFIKEGAFVIITGRNEEKLASAVSFLGENAVFYTLDVQDTEAGKKLIDKIYKKYNNIDILVNNAGVSLHEGNFLNVTEEGFDLQISTNLKGCYFLSQNYIKKYKDVKQENGQIIFITSERGDQCDDIPYGITKVAVNSLIEGLSRRFYNDGIRVNGVAPGVTASDMTNIKKDDNMYCNYNCSKRYFVPEEVAEAVIFLASDSAKAVSGEIIHTDAGNHLNPWFK